jgi:pilus assembly protein CpaB
MALFEDKKQFFILIAAVATGLVAAVLVSNFVQSSITTETNRIATQFQKKQQEKDDLYKQDMQALNQKVVEVEQRAQKAVQDAAKTAAAAAVATSRQTRPGEAVPKEKKFVSLALRTPAGKRAVTLKMDSLGAVGGLVNPGDYVDIISHLNVPARDPKNKDKKDSVTAMIFQNIQILAINTNIDQPGAYDEQQRDAGLKVTVAVTPEEASLLAFAEKNGNLELALRSPNEKKPAMISAATWSTLAEYVLQNTGAELRVPDETEIKAKVVESEEDFVPRARKKTDPYDPSIVVIKGGKGAN